MDAGKLVCRGKGEGRRGRIDNENNNNNDGIVISYVCIAQQ